VRFGPPQDRRLCSSADLGLLISKMTYYVTRLALNSAHLLSSRVWIGIAAGTRSLCSVGLFPHLLQITSSPQKLSPWKLLALLSEIVGAWTERNHVAKSHTYMSVYHPLSLRTLVSWLLCRCHWAIDAKFSCGWMAVLMLSRRITQWSSCFFSLADPDSFVSAVRHCHSKWLKHNVLFVRYHVVS